MARSCQRRGSGGFSFLLNPIVASGQVHRYNVLRGCMRCLRCDALEVGEDALELVEREVLVEEIDLGHCEYDGRIEEVLVVDPLLEQAERLGYPNRRLLLVQHLRRASATLAHHTIAREDRDRQLRDGYIGRRMARRGREP